MSHATPVRGGERIRSLDVLRGVALFGILLMNIAQFGLPMSYSDPSVWGGASGANLWAWITTTMLFEGTQRATFSILFGAGVILLTSRLESSGGNDVADIYYRRTLWLIVFGLVHSYLLLWTGEILYFYGLIGLFLYPLRKLAPRALVLMAVAGFIFGAIWSVGESYVATQIWEKAQAAQAAIGAGGEATEEQQADIDAWAEFEKETKPDELTLRKDIEAHQGSYVDVVTFQAPVNAHFESWYSYRYFFDIFSMMLLGMALYKLGVLTLARPFRVYLSMLLIGYTIGLAVNYYELQIVLAGNFSVLSFLRASWTYDLGRIAMTAGHLGTLLLFCRSGWLRWLQRSLAAIGQMALTSYVTHSVLCAIVFYGFGFGLYSELERHQLYYVVGSIWVFQLIVSPMWLARYRFGPLEWLWRSLTYLQPQPMRRRAPSDSMTPEPQSL